MGNCLRASEKIEPEFKVRDSISYTREMRYKGEYIRESINFEIKCNGVYKENEMSYKK